MWLKWKGNKGLLTLASKLYSKKSVIKLFNKILETVALVPYKLTRSNAQTKSFFSSLHMLFVSLRSEIVKGRTIDLVFME